MTTENELKSRALSLQAEVSAKMADPNLTGAQKAEFLDKAEKENGEIATGMKNLERARHFAAGNDLTRGDGTPVETRDNGEAHYAQLNDTFAQMKAHAAGKKQGNFTFELKAQGTTGLMGEAAAGTTAPGALGAGNYFLGGAAGASIAPQFLPGIVEQQFYQLTVADLFSSTPVDSPVVTYVRETAWANGAKATNEGETYGQSTNGVGRLTEQVGKVTNSAKVTDEMIQDAPYFWSLVQRRLPEGLKRQEEVQLIAGSGMPGVNGLLNRTAGFTQGTAGLTAVTNVAFPAAATAGAGTNSGTVASLTPGRQIKGTGTTGTAPTGVQIAEGIFAGLNDIRFKTFFEPDAILMNPLDWATIRLAKDSNGQYLGGSFFGTNYGNSQSIASGGAVDTGLTLWGKRVLTTPVIPQSFILPGAFHTGGTVLRRGGLTVSSTNTNGTEFDQGIWSVKADERIGLLVERPELFELIQLANS
ncbi:phage major capsid protein [Rhodococcus qingshengii]|uniref:phage major capsid protein n=1 Tax=Rhodococcus TaxID=1827 RepID=UPI000C9FD34C|nr:phage major capsid protein [Rhodococcus qingshengii]AUS34607.1 phage major capsid protein [Rhodococcus qingshengii]